MSDASAQLLMAYAQLVGSATQLYQVVITETDDIECIRSQDFDVSQIGSNPNVFVAWHCGAASCGVLVGNIRMFLLCETVVCCHDWWFCDV